MSERKQKRKKEKGDESTGGGGGGGGGGKERARDKRKREEPLCRDEDFGRKDFDAGAWADALFQACDRDRARAVCAGLETRRSAAAVQMKRSVFENHGKLLATSKAVERLDSDLKAVRESTRLQLSQVCHLTDATAPGTSDMLLLASVLDATSPQRARTATTTATATKRGGSGSGSGSGRSSGGQGAAVAAAYGRDVEWLLALPARLRVARAKHDHAAAVADLTELRGRLAVRPVLQRALEGTALQAALDREHAALVRRLVRDARRASSGSGAAVPAVGAVALALLDDLGLGAVAQGAFLDAWAARLGADGAAGGALGGRGAQFDGDVLRYVGRASAAFFALLSDAVHECLARFDSGAATSRLADWAATEILAFCQRLAQRALSSETPDTVARCARLLVFHCRTLLPAGFDLSFVIQQHFPQVSDSPDPDPLSLSSSSAAAAATGTTK